MRSVYSKFAALGTIADEQARIKSLAQAINAEFSLPALFNELGGAVAANDNGIKVFGQGAATGVTTDAIKAALVRKWAVPGDNPGLQDQANRVQQFFHTNMPDMDLGYTQLFDYVDMRTSQHDSFDILDANNGITWSQIKRGAEIKIRRGWTESVASIKALTFGDGVGIQDDWLRYQKWWTVQDTVAEFNAQYWDKKARLHYDLFNALGNGVNVAYAGDDTQTLNGAAAGILRKLEGKGYGIGSGAGFVILCPPEVVGRITKMLTASAGSLIVAYNANVQPVTVRVSAVVASTKIPANLNGYYLVLPGRKLKRADWQDLQTESARNIYMRGEDIVGTGSYNAAIGNTDQVARVLFQ